MPEISSIQLTETSIGSFTFENGTTVPNATFQFALLRAASDQAPLVVVCPSLTGDPTILLEWWRDVAPVGATEQYHTLFPHAFGASTSAALGANAPGIRDLARGILALVASLRLPHPAFVTGGSLGGMLALETGLESGAPTETLVLAAPAVQTAWGAGWNAIQLQALAVAGPEQGMMIARAVGMMTYRTELEFETRFGHDAVGRDGRTIDGYLTHHGRKLLARMDVAEYERRVRAMDGHDAGRGRGGWQAAIAPHASRITAVGIEGDSLYSAAIVRAWCDATQVRFRSLTSLHGHDAFLLERGQMRTVIAESFARATALATPASLAAE